MTRTRLRRFGPAALILLACLPCCVPLALVVWAALLGATGGWLATGSAALALVGLLVGVGVVAIIAIARRRRHTAIRAPLVLLDEGPRPAGGG